MKNYLVKIYGLHENLIKELEDYKLIMVSECVQRRSTEYIQVIVSEKILPLIEEKYKVEIEGDLFELSRKVQAMVGKGNRFSSDILNIEII